ncbi:MAG TPA: RNA polymerase sigma factor [Bacteroidales bacterium]|jgi:RNA polymerase sigma factor (sigma-70 family)|nr:RNA polymerase sigma factor [Bacteroidales bacterium]
MSPRESEKISSAYNLEKEKLMNYIRRRVPDRPEAEDILQDVFYQLTVGFRDLDRIENLTAWLYRVTNNRIIDRFRKKRPERMNHSDRSINGNKGPVSLAEILPALGSTPEDEEIKEMIWEEIEEVLGELPAEQREVFVAHEFEDKSFREISEATGVAINTLLSRKRYAVLALRSRLEKLYKLLLNK